MKHPKLSFNEWNMTGKIYLNFIIDFRDLDLGEIKIPK
jgi:hypothetical protein